MEKYKIKIKEAESLADFLVPMLQYYPERRATAQQMLSHPWLTQEANFEYKMSEREYESMQIRGKGVKKPPLSGEGGNLADVIESDNEMNMADDEDNEDLSDLDDSDLSLEEPDLINIQNFNNSFAAYGQHVNLAALDKANPQFNKIIKQFEKI